MRALRLTMNAFGPFKHKQHVDFTELGEESIFLITGPTGAGKTSIFDAMCFALYGRASGTDRDQDTLKSHFATPEETTYVEFEFMLRGKHYRIVRHPKQMKKKERGEGFKEEPTRADFYILQNGEKRLMASKIKEVNEMVEELLRLDYEQFRKMIMIPQGEFRRLISENSKEREEILQKIFRTYFYSELTDHFRSAAKGLESKINEFDWKITQEIENVQWEEPPEDEKLPAAVVKDLEVLIQKQKIAVEKTEEKHAELQAKTEQASDTYHKAQGVEELFREKSSLIEEQKGLTSKAVEIKDIEKQIELAQKALEVKPYERQLKERKEESVKLQKLVEQRGKLRKELEAKSNLMTEKYKEEREKESERESLKEQLKHNQQLRDKLDEYLNLKKQVKENEQSLRVKEEQKQQFTKKKNELEHQKEKMSEVMAEEREITKALYEEKQKLTDLERTLKNAERLFAEWRKLLDLRKHFDNLRKEARQEEKLRDSAKAKYEQVVEALQQNHAYHLAAQLTPGGFCPVCGSLEHPSLAEKPEEIPSNENIDQLKREYEKYEKLYLNKHEQMTTAKVRGTSQRELVESIKEESKDLKVEELTSEVIQEKLEKLRQNYQQTKSTVNSWQKKLAEVEETGEKLKEIEAQLATAIQQEEACVNELLKVKEGKVSLEAQVKYYESQYQFPEESALGMEQIVQHTKQKLKKALESWQSIQQQYQETSEHLQRAATEERESERQLKQAFGTLENKKIEHDQTLRHFGFSDEEDYQKALLEPGEIQKLKDQTDQYYRRKTAVEDRLQSLEDKIKDVSRPDLKRLYEAWQQVKQEALTVQQQVSEQLLQFKHNEKIYANLQQLIQQQEKVAKDYYDLAEISNLAKGDNPLRLSLERYVLASYLDEILLQANLRLDQMSDHRYQLIRSEQIAKRGAQSGLDLEVIDHHTGQTRSVRTLSGGEGFKASLSLALGMADVVQAHSGGVQLDTLFIDEGFGTLDEVSLEQAINCLRSLQDGNRMLGVISHVQQLKEEIPAKLQVYPSSSGSSVQFSFQ
ncbi:SbcC/MukB-like Walker B domain-containing protein [Halobacillus sp. Marseille-Q1614]|uniref:SbcC/MukB-like Walker B domain-containing protein n=1 Tax=Halobacillus sp. Marseille-Q1614 TaxID=2709134 RepID=UPI00156F82FE|nr:SbcC/MukB-like Walker B domain-containing protein [Halobacillus sp. Marseille-Q1614]